MARTGETQVKRSSVRRVSVPASPRAPSPFLASAPDPWSCLPHPLTLPHSPLPSGSPGMADRPPVVQRAEAGSAPVSTNKRHAVGTSRHIQ
eukprot:6043359-Prymnesium_polylepis.1